MEDSKLSQSAPISPENKSSVFSSYSHKRKSSNSLEKPDQTDVDTTGFHKRFLSQDKNEEKSNSQPSKNEENQSRILGNSKIELSRNVSDCAENETLKQAVEEEANFVHQDQVHLAKKKKISSQTRLSQLLQEKCKEGGKLNSSTTALNAVMCMAQAIILYFKLLKLSRTFLQFIWKATDHTWSIILSLLILYINEDLEN